jgi:hypothetical protein
MNFILDDYNKLILKKIIILIPKNKENMLSFLAPIIGIHGIKINLFIEEFEKKTKRFGLDFIIPVHVIIYKINTYDLTIKVPYISFFLNEFNFNISVLYIFKLAIIKSLFNFFFIKINYKMIRSYIKSLHEIKNNFKLIKYNFFVCNNLNIFYFKKIFNYFFFIRNYLNLNYGFFLLINNINYYNIKLLINLQLLKIPNFYNIYLLGDKQVIRVIEFFKLNKNIIFLKKNIFKFLFIKYKYNFLQIKFFDLFLKNLINIYKLNYILQYVIFNFLNIITNQIQFICKFLINNKN